MQATEGLAIRSYNSGTMYKGAFDLLPDEQPRKQYAFPAQGDPCPHCGKMGHMVWRPLFCHCHYCGFVKQMPPETVMPLTPEMLQRGVIKGGIALLDRTCTACGRTFRTPANKPKEICQRCRQRATDNRWRDAHPEQYRETQTRHAALIKEKKAKKREAGKEFL